MIQTDYGHYLLNNPRTVQMHDVITAVALSVFSGTSVPGIAELNDGTGDADGQLSTSVKFRGKTDMIIQKGKLLGNVNFLCL